VANKSSNNEQIDADILRGKKNILRASDIMPPYSTGQEVKPQEATTDKERTKRIKPSKEKPAGALSSQGTRPEIPRFDLAEQILAEQRRISAIRRKAPNKKTDAQEAEKEVEPVGYAVGWSTPAEPYQQQIIAEIVARDIERLCRGNYSANSNW